MRAAVLRVHGGPLEIEDISQRDLWATAVRVRIDATGVCHSDLLVQQGVLPYPTPVILGHEGAGTVVEVGSGTTRVRVGDRVICSFLPACGDCWWCLNGHSHLCEGLVDTLLSPRGTRADDEPVFGMSGLGTFAEEVVTDQGMVVPVHTDLAPEHLALIGCGVMTGVGAVLNRAKVAPGSSVAIIGCGGVGQAAVQGARIAGAARVFAIDPIADKRALALSLGATDGVDPSAVDPVEYIREATGGRGADYAIEAIGRPEGVAQAYASIRKGGMAITVGMPPLDATVSFSAFDLMANDKMVAGCMYGSANVRRDFPRIVELAESGRLDLEALISRRISLAEVNEAFASLQRGDVIRSVICPS